MKRGVGIKFEIKVEFCVCVCVCSEIRERRDLKFQSVSKGGRRLKGAAVEADRLEEIKELKIDGHSEKFKDWNIAIKP